MPSYSIFKFTILPGPLRVSAEFLILSTGPLLYIILSGPVKIYAQNCLQAPADLKSAGNRGGIRVPGGGYLSRRYLHSDQEQRLALAQQLEKRKKYSTPFGRIAVCRMG